MMPLRKSCCWTIWSDMRHLCDSNIFVALAAEAHPHHRRAIEWLGERAEGEILFFCRATQNTFLRLLTTRQMMSEQVCTNDQAIAAYRKLRADARVGFLNEEPREIEKHWLGFAGGREVAPKRWMDAYLAGW